MHDVGTFVWVVLVVIGVVSSIVSNARKRVGPPAGPAASQGTPPYVVSPQAMPPQRMPPGAPPPAVGAAPPAAPRRVVPARPPSPPAPPPAADHTLDVFRPAHRRGPRVFGGRGALVRAVIGAEVLGKPVALRDE